MSPSAERRSLQAAFGLAALVPVSAGGLGIILSAEMIKGVAAPLAIDLDSQFRYLSGLLFGIGLAFAAQIPRIERQGPTIRLLAAIVVTGGLARLAGVGISGLPNAGHLFGLVMELAVVPMLVLWQARVAKLCR